MTLKKALVAITVVAMLFGMVGTAFAATSFPDVTDSKTAAAAVRLNALGVVTGYPDGNFGVGDTITRAQFAAIAVRALGLDSAAGYAKGATKFSDVAADYWASGYINVAADQGLIKGYPDGKFGPDDKVTYAQSLAIIVRMLGYEPIVKGSWPTNYIVQAAKIGFSSGVAFNANDNATRGNVALFVDSALSKPLMVENGVVAGQPSYGIDPNKTLLSENLGATPTSGLLVESADLFANTATGIKIHPVTGTDVTKTLATGVSAAGLLGRNVRAWEKGGYVFFVEPTDDPANIVTGKVLSVDTTNKTITLTTLKSYSYDATATYFFHNGATAAATDVLAGDDITLLMNGTTAASVVDFTYTPGVVTSVDVAGKLVSTTAGNLDLSSTTARYSVSMDGKAISVADIQKDDVVQFYTQGNSLAASANKVVIVTRKAVTGSVTQRNADGSVVLGGVTYKKLSTVTDASVDALLGVNAKALLDKDGKIASISAVAAAQTSTYAVVSDGKRAVNTTSGVDYYFTVVKADGSTAYLKLASLVSVGGAPAVAPSDTTVALAKDNVISYTVDSTGAVDSYSVRTDTPGTVAVDSINKTAGGLAVTSSTVIFKVPGGTTAPTAVTAADFLKNSSVTGYVVADTVVTARAAVIVYSSGNYVASSPVGLVTAKYKDSFGWKLTVFTGGAATTYVADAVYADANAAVGKVNVFTLSTTASGTIASLTNLTQVGSPGATDHVVVASYNAADKILGYKVLNASNQTIGSGYILLNADTQFVDNSGTSAVAGTEAGLTVGRTIEIYDNTAVGAGIADMIVLD